MKHLRELSLLVATVIIQITMTTSMGGMPGMPGHSSPVVNEDTCQQPKTRIINYTGKSSLFHLFLFFSSITKPIK